MTGKVAAVENIGDGVAVRVAAVNVKEVKLAAGVVAVEGGHGSQRVAQDEGVAGGVGVGDSTPGNEFVAVPPNVEGQHAHICAS